MSIFLIILFSVIFGVSVLVLISAVAVVSAKRAMSDWRAANPETKIIMLANGANCAVFPDKSSTLRGNGLLVLTSDALHFKMWGLDNSIVIPLDRIVFADVVRSYAGRWGRLPMLRVSFLSELGTTMETAWSLAGAANWVETINEMKNKKVRR